MLQDFHSYTYAVSDLIYVIPVNVTRSVDDSESDESDSSSESESDSDDDEEETSQGTPPVQHIRDIHPIKPKEEDTVQEQQEQISPVATSPGLNKHGIADNKPALNHP